MDRIVSTDGTPISVHRHGEGPPLILVHGAAADRTRWAPLLPELGRHFTVLAMDRRGRGESGDQEPYAIEREYEDLAAVVEAAGPGTSLLGHSYGAILALEAATRSKNLRRLVLYEPTFRLDGRPVWPPETVARLDALLEAEGREAMLTAFYREVVGASEADIEALRRQPAWAGRLAAAHTILREMRAIGDLPDAQALGRIAVPTLLLVGEVSPPTFTGPVARLATMMPKARLLVLPGQGHVAMSTAPDLFLREVLGFLTA